ncbi:glycoside hydrolase family 13 protein, partial [Candidatus Poribacteria bacterium]|nr:glycoside hydrolase family 13 protein [Candidatus Poribacteria bacterium]
YLDGLGVDVVYLNPIHKAYTNHKYDAQDYFAVSEEYGTREDVIALADALHGRGMRLMLDGVFNHMGRTSPQFQEAMTDESSKWRDWYYIGPEYQRGYRAWANVENLPELNLENPAVRARIWGGRDSVVQGYVRDGVDGWRLDVAFDIGFQYLDELTRGAHSARVDSLVIGEVWNYPAEWFPALDGVMNMHAREIVLSTVRGELSGARAGQLLGRMCADADFEHLLKSWIILDNHDVPRLKTILAEDWQQRMAQVLQFTLPGSPCIYYGVEVGMEGGDDPEQRAPMRWDLVSDDNPGLAWMRRLIAMRQEAPALRHGDFLLLDTGRLLAFMRKTDRVEDTRIVIVNPEDAEVAEVVPLRDSKLMSYGGLRDTLSPTEVGIIAGVTRVRVPPRTAWVLKPVIPHTIEYSPYKRVQ